MIEHFITGSKFLDIQFSFQVFTLEFQIEDISVYLMLNSEL